MSKPVIVFNKYEILKIDYTKVDELPEDFDNEMQTKIAIGYTEDLTAGKVEIDITIIEIEASRKVNVVVRGLFTINEDLEDEEKIEMYLSQNGTAILYPYIRSIFSFISTFDSDNAIILPTINTLELNDNE